MCLLVCVQYVAILATVAIVHIYATDTVIMTHHNTKFVSIKQNDASIASTSYHLTTYVHSSSYQPNVRHGNWHMHWDLTLYVHTFTIAFYVASATFK